MNLSCYYTPLLLMLIPTGSVSAEIAVPRFQTAQAYGENLTCIGIQVIIIFELFKHVLPGGVGVGRQ